MSKKKDKCKTNTDATKILISCLYDTNNVANLPLGFDWCQNLSTLFKDKYKQIIVIHGETLKYSLKDKYYKKKYGVSNPFFKFLAKLHYEYKVKIVVCNYCLEQNGFVDSEILSFIKPIKYAPDYIVQAQVKGNYTVLYDGKLTDSK